MPIVATDVDEAYMVKQGASGMISKGESSIANALIAFIDRPGYWSKLAANGSSFASHDSWVSIAPKCEEDVFKPILEKAARQSISAS